MKTSNPTRLLRRTIRMTLEAFEDRLAIAKRLKAVRRREKHRLKLARRYDTRQRIVGTIRGLSRAIRVVENAPATPAR